MLIALPLLLVCGCVIAIGTDGSSWSWPGNWGGSRLPHSHTESLPLGSDLERLEVRAGSGDIRVGPAQARPQVVATIREEEPGDGYLVLEGDRLTVRSHAGLRVDLGDVTLHLAGHTRALDLSTGSGDVKVESIDLTGKLAAGTGSGSIRVERIGGNPAVIALGTGSGRVIASDFRADELVVDTGSGNVEVRRVQVTVGSFDTGSGSIRLAESRIRRAQADTGSGDIDARGSELGSRAFSTGSGSVRVDD